MLLRKTRANSQNVSDTYIIQRQWTHPHTFLTKASIWGHLSSYKHTHALGTDMATNPKIDRGLEEKKKKKQLLSSQLDDSQFCSPPSSSACPSRLHCGCSLLWGQTIILVWNDWLCEHNWNTTERKFKVNRVVYWVLLITPATRGCCCTNRSSLSAVTHTYTRRCLNWWNHSIFVSLTWGHSCSAL